MVKRRQHPAGSNAPARRFHWPNLVVGSCVLLLVSCLGSAGRLVSTNDPIDSEDEETNFPEPGHITFESPHSRPIALANDGAYLYTVNTPADSVDVIDVVEKTIVDRINVGIDPVGLAFRPDGLELWVSNHVSDSVSVINTNAESPAYHQVVDTVQVFDEETRSTRFDEPVGIAFANNDKVYVALSSTNEIAVIDVASRTVSKRLEITAQDPRALVVRNERLYVIPFESNNQTAISGCFPENLDDELCTFDADRHVVNAPDGNAQSLSLGYVADIIRHPDVPDRDLYVFETENEDRLQIVSTLGTLLYGLAVDSDGNVFVAQAEARNDANGKAGTAQHGLAELENRTFLNQITRIDCSKNLCDSVEFLDLEPLPPDDPEPGTALATPFGIQISNDDSTLVVTAAASDRVFTMDAGTGEVLGRVDVEAIPRGLALVHDEDNTLTGAWVLNALENSVSYLDLAAVSEPVLVETIPLFDPTETDLKAGRIAFNSARGSTSGTFSCASCHPDGHTDQLLWVLDTPLCDVGCDQIQPRLVQDVRGLRGTAPYHWDGIPGDPFGGVNTANITRFVEPNCDIDDEESCTRHLVDNTMAKTMCDIENCSLNDEEKAGPFDAEERTAMAKYLLNVPYPISVERPYTNTVTDVALTGIEDFHFVKQCGNCHLLPHWTTTNMGGSGMDLPTWRGASDRWKNAPQNRFFFPDFVRGDTRGFPERFSFTNDPDMYQMILEGSVGFTGSLGRQVTLSEHTATDPLTKDLLDALEVSAAEEAVLLRGEGIFYDEEDEVRDLQVAFVDGLYVNRNDETHTYTREDLLYRAKTGELLITLTARLGPMVDYDHPQPTLWPIGLPILPVFPGARPAEFPELVDNKPIRMNGDYIFENANVILDGRRVPGSVACEQGELPHCEHDVVLITLEELPEDPGIHLLQVQNEHGLFSNDFPFFVLEEPWPGSGRNLISSGGRFNDRGDWQVSLNGADVSWNGEADFSIRFASPRPWDVALSHTVAVRKDVEYSLCYRAKSDEFRYIQVNVDTGPGQYQSLMGTHHIPEVGAAARGSGTSTYEDYFMYRHRFVATQTDYTARINFQLAQSDVDVQLDSIGLYEGKGCGYP